ncbi:hypothetical protein [Azospirillum doebereinerae]
MRAVVHVILIIFLRWEAGNQAPFLNFLDLNYAASQKIQCIAKTN